MRTLAQCLLLATTLGLTAPASIAAGEAPAQVKVTKKKVRTAIAWKVTPGHVEVYLDGKKLGRASDIKETRTRPGRHTVRLVKGEDESEMDVQVNKGHVLTFTFEFSE